MRSWSISTPLYSILYTHTIHDDDYVQREKCGMRTKLCGEQKTNYIRTKIFATFYGYIQHAQAFNILSKFIFVVFCAVHVCRWVDYVHILLMLLDVRDIIKWQRNRFYKELLLQWWRRFIIFFPPFLHHINDSQGEDCFRFQSFQ